jgi:hypothetical protein
MRLINVRGIGTTAKTWPAHSRFSITYSGVPRCHSGLGHPLATKESKICIALTLPAHPPAAAFYHLLTFDSLPPHPRRVSLWVRVATRSSAWWVRLALHSHRRRRQGSHFGTSTSRYSIAMAEGIYIWRPPCAGLSFERPLLPHTYREYSLLRIWQSSVAALPHLPPTQLSVPEMGRRATAEELLA